MGMILPFSAQAQSIDQIFWSQEYAFGSGTNRIGRVTLDGVTATDILTGSNLSGGAIASALDLINLKLYWSDRSGNIKRSNLDGSSVQNLVSGQSLPWHIKLDVAQGKMYWTTLDGTTIRRANVDGSSIQTLYTGSSGTGGLDLDLQNSKVYFTVPNDNTVLKMNLDGTNQSTVISSGLNNPISIALNVTGNKMYIADYYSDAIQLSTLTGSGLTQIVTSEFDVNHVTFNSITNKIYWTLRGGSIRSADPDGSNKATIKSGLGAHLRQISFDIDRDEDGILNSLDGCPIDPLKSAAGQCGCGIADTDSDSDGTANCNDACSSDPGKLTAGICGCGVADTDSDGDSTANCNDACVNDPGKIVVGVCGCGVAETDTDSDGTPNCTDACQNDPGKISAGICGCGIADADTDLDETYDCNDGCPDDVVKTAPGACGCGNLDIDDNDNDIMDCLPEEGLYEKAKKLKNQAGKGSSLNVKNAKKTLSEIKTLAEDYPENGNSFTKSELDEKIESISKKLNALIKSVKNSSTSKSKMAKQKKAVKDELDEFIAALLG
ncbi:MAG: hypothetical protein SGJ02_06525 [bacterium]|nr:hypothetical protein [bacterium]